uniref:Reverse transcriptase domain-containing protein n=1 Tax=Romanomermis culicivorax TaxID=13658 RepID=A0A915KV45_ROMCU
MRHTGARIGTGIHWCDRKRLEDLDFTDDIALLEETEEKLQWGTLDLQGEAGKVGLRISTEKSKIMNINNTNPWWGMFIGMQKLEEVEKFTYLGSVISEDGNAQVYVKCRIRKMVAVFRRMNKIWVSPTISLKIKLCLLNSIMFPTAIYARETWKASASINKLDVFQQPCLCGTLKIRFTDHITNEEVLRWSGTVKLHDIVAQKLFKELFKQAPSFVIELKVEWRSRATEYRLIACDQSVEQCQLLGFSSKSALKNVAQSHVTIKRSMNGIEK